MKIKYNGKTYKFVGKEIFGRKIKRVVESVNKHLAIVTQENEGYKVLHGTDEMVCLHSYDSLIQKGFLAPLSN